MFWKGKSLAFKQIQSYLKDEDLSLATDLTRPELSSELNPHCKISAASVKDVDAIADLLNRWFEPLSRRVATDVTGEWIRSTYLAHAALWLVARDRGGTIRGCISSFRIQAPYPNSLGGCGVMHPWGIVDWFCVHPLWRNKGVGTALLEALDVITFRVGRKAHIFIKEGLPLMPPQMPVYTTFLKCRRAGKTGITSLREDAGLVVYNYHMTEKDTGLPLIRIEGLRGPTIKDHHITRWEDALDSELPPCLVFVSEPDHIDASRGWKTDSLVSMYAFRWIAGKWLGSVPSQEIV
jgi:GNAT superfamily N-acetyltransferase